MRPTTQMQILAEQGHINAVAGGMAVRRKYSKSGNSYSTQLFKKTANNRYRKVNRG